MEKRLTDIVAVNEAVGILDLPTLKTKLVTNSVAVVTTGRGIGHNTFGSRPGLWCGNLATRWNADGSVSPDIVAVEEAVGGGDSGAGQAEIPAEAVAGISSFRDVGHHAVAARASTSTVGGTSGRNAEGGVGPDIIAVNEAVGGLDGTRAQAKLALDGATVFASKRLVGAVASGSDTYERVLRQHLVEKERIVKINSPDGTQMGVLGPVQRVNSVSKRLSLGSGGYQGGRVDTTLDGG